MTFFGVDPDPRIDASDKWIRIWMWIWIFVIDLQEANTKN
jgi:hypothetical protein